MPHDLQPATLLKKRLWRRCFPVNFSKFLGVSSKCKLTASHQNQKHKIHSNMFSSLPKSNFFCQFVDRKAMGSMQKYDLLGRDTNYIFSLA